MKQTLIIAARLYDSLVNASVSRTITAHLLMQATGKDPRSSRTGAAETFPYDTSS